MNYSPVWDLYCTSDWEKERTDLFLQLELLQTVGSEPAVHETRVSNTLILQTPVKSLQITDSLKGNVHFHQYSESNSFHIIVCFSYCAVNNMFENSEGSSGVFFHFKSQSLDILNYVCWTNCSLVLNDIILILWWMTKVNSATLVFLSSTLITGLIESKPVKWGVPSFSQYSLRSWMTGMAKKPWAHQYFYGNVTNANCRGVTFRNELQFNFFWSSHGCRVYWTQVSVSEGMVFPAEVYCSRWQSVLIYSSLTV